MTFTVTHRSQNGGRVEECFEAESRDELFKILSGKGISPIRIYEGKSQTRQIGNRKTKLSAIRPVICIAAVILSVAAVGVWWFSSRDDQLVQPTVEKPKKVPHKVEPKISKPKPVPEPAEQPLKWPERSPHPDGEWRHGEGPRSIAVTNGCLVTYPHYPGVQMVLPHPAFAPPFETLLDNEIARIVSAKPGDGFIDVPLPKNFDEKFAESLLVPIEISEDDTPEKAELKRQVKEARKILVEAVKRGESPRQILTEEAKTLRKLMQTRDNYQRILNEQIQSGASDQEINDTVNAANKMLEREGSDAKVILPWKTKIRIQQGKSDGTVLD